MDLFKKMLNPKRDTEDYITIDYLIKEFFNGNLSKKEFAEQTLTTLQNCVDLKIINNYLDNLMEILKEDNEIEDLLFNYLDQSENPAVKVLIIKILYYNFSEKFLEVINKIIVPDTLSFILNTISLLIENKARYEVLNKKLDLYLQSKYKVVAEEARAMLSIEAKYQEICIRNGYRLKTFGRKEFREITNKHFIKLNFSDSIFDELPDCWDKFKFLKELSLTDNPLKAIPDSIYRLAKANFSQKYIDEGVIFEEADILALLEILTGGRMLKVVEKDILRGIWDARNYKINANGHITGIAINNNEESRIGIIPIQLFRLKDLKQLYLTLTDIKLIPNEIKMLKSLELLDLQDNKIDTIPDSLCELIKLKKLDLSYNNIKKIPNRINQLKELEELILTNNKIENIPTSVFSLTSLQILSLGSNEIKLIPDLINSLINLKTLNLTSNNIKEIPETIKSLQNLEILHLEGNQIEDLPEELYRIKTLKFLYLSKNKIKKISSSIESLNLLKYLFISDNLIEEIPELLGNLSSLTLLVIHGNPIKVIPEDIKNKIKIY
ncbi:MAG: leucine-rich repeat domain-containing protein [Candidatus Hermodarchaeota archaeon]